jgi:hypothetical protein
VASRPLIAPGCPNAYDAVLRRRRTTGPPEGEGSMKKLLVVLILVAIGIAVAKKVREA